MRLLIFFDLPTKSKCERKQAQYFRNYLIKDGFFMMQWSVYTRCCQNEEDVLKHIRRLKKHLPEDGNIRALSVTEKQFDRMSLLLGSKKSQEIVSSQQLVLF